MSLAEYFVFLITLLMTTLSSVNSQPLEKTPEKFQCGNLTCKRWGYTACVNSDEEFYCIPCSQEYVSDLCGKSGELPGCNLYCTQKEMDKEKKKLDQLFSNEKENMKKKFTALLAKEKNRLRNQTIQNQEDVDLYLSKIKTLRDVITEERRYKNICFVTLIVSLLSLGGLVIWFLWWRKRTKTTRDVEALEETRLLKADAEKGNCDGAEGSQCSDGCNCPGKDMLQNVSPTSDRDGCDKIAIHENDISVPTGD